MAAEKTKKAAAKKESPENAAAKKKAPAKTAAQKPAAKNPAPAKKKAPTKKPTAKKAEAKKETPKREANVTLKPVTDKAAPEPAAAPAAPTAEQIAAWRSLPQEQRTALREREAARIFLDAAEAHRNGDLNAAIEGYGKSLLLNPKEPDVYNNMGVALRAQGKLEAAVACYRRSLVLKANSAGVYSNMGNALRELGRLQVASACHQQAIKLSPDSPEPYYNLGLVLRDLGQVDQAMASFDKTLSLKDDHVDCRWDRALTLLTKGDYARGFEEYDWRWKLERSPPRGFKQPLWDGSELKGKTILIHQEQGFGDMIHFARYLPMVKEKGGTVVLEVQPELSRLFESLDGVDKVINKGSPLPRFDVYAPMMTLAKIFGTTVESIPASIPYITAPDIHAVQLPPPLTKTRRIGITWAGRPTHQNDVNRSCEFKHFIELLGVPNTTVFSLQKGDGERDIAEGGCQALVMNLAPRLNDFADTAAVISQLDMVITVDTAIAHLAGAMGKPVWVVMPFAGDWRWMARGTTTPWYPTMRLFRQAKPGGWDRVFREVRKALRDELGLDPVSTVRL